MKELLMIGLWPVISLTIDDGHNDCELEAQDVDSRVGWLMRAVFTLLLLPAWFAVALMVCAWQRLGKEDDGRERDE